MYTHNSRLALFSIQMMSTPQGGRAEQSHSSRNNHTERLGRKPTHTRTHTADVKASRHQLHHISPNATDVIGV